MPRKSYHFLTQLQPHVAFLCLDDTKHLPAPGPLQFLVPLPRMPFLVFTGPSPLFYSDIRPCLTLLEKSFLINKVKPQKCPSCLATPLLCSALRKNRRDQRETGLDVTKPLSSSSVASVCSTWSHPFLSVLQGKVTSFKLITESRRDLSYSSQLG